MTGNKLALLPAHQQIRHPKLLIQLGDSRGWSSLTGRHDHLTRWTKMMIKHHHYRYCQPPSSPYHSQSLCLCLWHCHHHRKNQRCRLDCRLRPPPLPTPPYSQYYSHLTLHCFFRPPSAPWCHHHPLLVLVVGLHHILVAELVACVVSHVEVSVLLRKYPLA